MKIKSPLKFCIFLIAVLIVVGGAYYAIDSITGFFGIQLGFFGKADAFMQRGSVNFLVCGVDEDQTRTDLIMVAQYNFKTGECNILQIPRDLKVNTQRYDKKINSAYGSSEKQVTLAKELKSVIGLDIDRYVIVNFKGFRDIIDAIGGVEVDVPVRMYYTDPEQNLTIDLRKGSQVLDGRHAEMFMRFRKNNDGTGYAEGDVGRITAQKQFYNAAIDKIKSARTVLQVPKLVEIVQKSIKTDLQADEIFRYVNIGLKADREKVNIFQLPGGGDYEVTNGVSISYFFHDKEEMKKIINEYFTPGNANTAQNKTSDTVKINRNKNAAIKVEVINATGISSDNMDIGEIAANLLRDNAFNVQTVTVSPTKTEHTTLTDHNSKAASKEILKIFPDIPTNRDKEKESGCDVTLILGTDFSY